MAAPLKGMGPYLERFRLFVDRTPPTSTFPIQARLAFAMDWASHRDNHVDDTSAWPLQLALEEGWGWMLDTFQKERSRPWA